MKPSRKNVKPEAVPPAVSHQPAPPPVGFPGAIAFRLPRHALPLAGLCICTLLCYSSAFQDGLIYDSASRIVQDARVHAATSKNIDVILKSEYWYPSTGAGLYRPLTTLSFLFNYAILGNGNRPFGYHQINWILHTVNAMLVYLLALRILKRTALAFAAAAIWAVHPVLTESVTNVVGRADLLAAIGVLGGLLCYIEGTQASPARRWVWLGAAALATLVGVFSKESTVIVPAIVVLYEFTFGTAALRTARIAGYAALALPCLIYWIVRTQVFAGAPAMTVPFTDNPIASANWFAAKLTAIKVIGMELRLLAWPARLSCDYSYNQIPISSATDWKAWAALAACLVLVAGGVVAYRRNRPIHFWIGFFFLALAPTANLALVIGSPMAERFLYLPAIGFAGGVVAAVYALFQSPRARLGQAVLALVGLALAARTFARNFDWKDENSLWTSAVATAPASYKTHMSLAMNNSTVAIPEIERAIAIVNAVPDEINPAMPYVHGGRIYREAGDRSRAAAADQSRAAYQRALELLQRAVRIRAAHEERNQREGRPSIALSPVWSSLDLELGRVHGRLSQFDQSVTALRAALRYRIAPELFEELSVAYFKKGDTNQAAIALLEALVADLKNTKIASELASLYGMSAPGSCALEIVNGSTTVNLECPMVHQQICTASVNMAGLYRQIGQTTSAIQTVQRAVDSLHCAPELFQTGTPVKNGQVSGQVSER